MSMRYALERQDKQWSQCFLEIINSNPFTVSEDQLSNLYKAIKSELWPQHPPEELDLESSDPILYVVWFCRGVPAIIDIVGSVTEHLGQEFSWVDYARLMKRIVDLDAKDSDPKDPDAKEEINPDDSSAFITSGNNPHTFPIEPGIRWC